MAPHLRLTRSGLYAHSDARRGGMFCKCDREYSGQSDVAPYIVQEVLGFIPFIEADNDQCSQHLHL